MRFNVVICQQKCLDMGVNLSEAALMSLFNELSSWATEEVIDGVVYYHLSRNKVITELPFFFNKADTVYRNFKSLKDLQLIDYVKKSKKDLVRLTTKGKRWNLSIINSESNPNNNQTRKVIRANSETNPNLKNLQISDLLIFRYKSSDLNPTYNNKYTSDNSLREDLIFLKNNYPIVFEAFLCTETYYENLLRHVKRINNRIEFRKDVVPVIISWLRNRITSDNLNYNVGRLKSDFTGYLEAVIKRPKKNDTEINLIRPEFKRIG